MHHVVISGNELRSSDRWNVEYFIIDDKWIGDEKSRNFVPIGTLVNQLKKTLAPGEQPTSLFTYIGMENVEGGTGRFVGNAISKGSEILSRAKIAPSNCVLYGRLRPTLNKVALIPHDAAGWVCSTEFIVLEAIENKIHPRLLRELLASEYITSQVERFIRGASLPRLPAENLLTLKVPVPPMEEQLKIVERLRKLDNERDEVYARLSSLPQDYWTAISQASFEGLK